MKWPSHSYHNSLAKRRSRLHALLRALHLVSNLFSPVPYDDAEEVIISTGGLMGQIGGNNLDRKNLNFSFSFCKSMQKKQAPRLSIAWGFSLPLCSCKNAMSDDDAQVT